MASSTIIPNSDIVVRRDGVGDRAIVFMHGWIDDMHVWRPVIDELSAPGFETVQLDLAGFGDRTQANGPFTFDRFAADVLAVVDAVDKPFVLVGHSMAAPIVELVAAARPERALGLVLLAPIPMAGTRLPDEVMENFRSLAGAEASAIQAMRQQAGPSAPEAELARIAAVAAGASLVNDVSAQLWSVAAEHGVGWVAMHRQGTPADMQRGPHYDDVVHEVSQFLLERAEVARAAGVSEVWIDPGIGFGKSVQHNLALLGAVDALSALGYPVLVGTSRKSFLGLISPLSDGSPAPIDDRGPASLATATWALQRGASMIRVHDVGASVQAAVLVGPGRGERQPAEPVGAP